jgi:hypothetical protein
MEQKSLRAVDLGVALRLEHRPDEHYEDLARALLLSLSASYRCVQRLQVSGLLLPGARRVNRSALIEFLVHGARYAFPPSLGAEVRGVPTAGSLPSIGEHLPEGLNAVWPSAEGRVRGPGLVPLYGGAPVAALHDERLHRLLALVDVMRIGQSRDRKSAETMLRNMLLHG